MNKTPRQITAERALTYARQNLAKVDVQMGGYDGSQKCHHRSRQVLEEGGLGTVAVTLSFVPHSGVNIHFINKIGGIYIDHTLGYLSKFNTYYLIREYTLEDLQGISMRDLLITAKKEMLHNLFDEPEKTLLGIDLHSL